MKCSEIIVKLEELSPLFYAQSWDNPGLLCGRTDKEITKVMLAVDATDEVIEQAVSQQVSMLITHHPLIFKGLKQVRADHFIGRRLFRLIQEDICCYAMHTNFDVMGMADAAADEMGLPDRQVLDVTYEDEITREGIGRIGRLPESMTLEQCAVYVKRAFHLEQVRVFGEADAIVECAAICPGSGKSMVENAVRGGAQVLITGDIDHHDGLDAMAQGLCIIDAGHYGLEKIFVPYLEEYFGRKIRGPQVFRAREQAPFYFV